MPKITAFLHELSECGIVAEAARRVGMSRQAAYALRARLDAPKFRDAFERARRAGLRARAAASVRRSKWDGPGLSTLDYLRSSSAGKPARQFARKPAPQADAQADMGPSQTDTSATQNDR